MHKFCIVSNNVPNFHDVDFKLFLMARLPCQYFFLKSLRTTRPDFLRVSSKIQSHSIRNGLAMLSPNGISKDTVD